MLSVSDCRSRYDPTSEHHLNSLNYPVWLGSPLLIIVFGSRARGTAKPGSDLDILVIEEPDANLRRLDAAYGDAARGLFPNPGGCTINRPIVISGSGRPVQEYDNC